MGRSDLQWRAMLGRLVELKSPAVGPLPEEYRILSQVIDLKLPGYDAYYTSAALASAELGCLSRYEGFVDRLIAPKGCRLSGGEYQFMLVTR